MGYRKRVAVLGATGSIGQQALEVLRGHGDHFEVSLLTAQTQWQELVRLAHEFRPPAVVIGDVLHYESVLHALEGTPTRVYVGEEAMADMAGDGSHDVVLIAIVGYAGLLPTIRALESGCTVALANKESLVVAGELVMEVAGRHNAPLIPVDSEHSAIYQCLEGELTAPSRLFLTASGGPFLHRTAEELLTIDPQEALQHPAWNMGAKISVDSATMMNKGLEVIEAHWLFDMPYESIEVVVHPQAVIHSMVEFPDGSIKAQLGVADMRLPIQYALTYPFRVDSGVNHYRFGPHEDLTFMSPDLDRFPCLALALEAGRLGGTTPCILNAANEVAVESFLRGEIGFMSIAKVVERTLEVVQSRGSASLDEYVATNREARLRAQWVVTKLSV